MGGVNLPTPAAGTEPPALYDTRRRAMRILRPQPESGLPPAPALPPPAGAGEAPLRCRVRLADGRVFTGALPAARHRAIQLGLLHADTRRAGRAHARHARHRRAARARPPPPRRALPARRRQRPPRLAGGAARARRADRARRLRDAAASIGGPREEAFVGVAPRLRRARRQARRRPHALPVGRRRPARPAARPVGAAGRAARATC